MEITGMVHCLFEQSGTFKNQFIAMGIRAEDYDIQNVFGQTDNVVNLFIEIGICFDAITTGKMDSSIFAPMTANDLLLAFFPCTYFCNSNTMIFQGNARQVRSRTPGDRLRYLINRAEYRQDYWALLMKLCYIVEVRHLRLIIENPFSVDGYLWYNFPYRPAIIDYDRTLRGDYMVKPTQYFFIGCEPTGLQSIQRNKRKRYLQQLPKVSDTIEGAARSMISPDYARNFINDCILGRVTVNTQPTLFT